MSQVVVSSPEGLRQEIWTDHHTFVADEPKELGGTDAGPTPYALLLGALGACTSMTVKLYAQRNEWPLEGVEVLLRHQRVHARDCAECEQTGSYLDHVEMELVLAGPLTEEQVARLSDIADKCPVGRTLRKGVHTKKSVRLAAGGTASST